MSQHVIKTNQIHETIMLNKSKNPQHSIATEDNYCVHKNPPLVHTLSQMNPVPTLPPYFDFILHLSLGLPSRLLHCFRSKFYMHASFPTRSTSPANQITIDVQDSNTKILKWVRIPRN
jgi:hypothetical protein